MIYPVFVSLVANESFLSLKTNFCDSYFSREEDAPPRPPTDRSLLGAYVPSAVPPCQAL